MFHVEQCRTRLFVRIIGKITGEGFNCQIKEDSPDGEGFKRVSFLADADIDADGANGQNGGVAAYRIDNKGSELLANGGMGLSGGKVICAKPWARDIVILGKDNQPRVFPGGVIASRTWYRDRSKPVDDPSSYLDSETVRYIVVPPMIVHGVAGVVCGCLCRASYRGVSMWGVVGDLGPRNKVGEVSIEMARKLGIPSSPRTGGIDKPNVYYELWPGKPAPGYALLPS